MDYTHEIIRIERGATKGSGSPMWRCVTSDPNTEAIEALLRTAEKFHLRMVGHDE